MMEAMFLEGLFLNIVNMSIQAGIVALGVMLLRFIFRKAPRWIICLLWAMVAFRLMLPFSIESEYSVMSSRQVLPDDFIYAASPVINSGIGSVDDSVNEMLRGSLYTPPMNSVNRTQVLAFVCSSLWLLGMSGMLLYALISSLVLRHRMSDATVLRGNIKQSGRVTSPFVMGIFRPTVYLPYSIDESDREQVIRHEQVHIARRDHLSKVLAFVLLSVYWFHPLIWISYILFCRDMEKACDEKVISSMNEDERRDYASALLNCAAGRRIAAVSPLAFGEVSVKGRILGVMKYRKPALWLLIAVLVAAVIAAVCLLTDPISDRISGTPLHYKNAASAAAGNGEMRAVRYTADSEESDPTAYITDVDRNEFSAYLLSRNWEETEENGHRIILWDGQLTASSSEEGSQTDGEQIGFMITDDYRMTSGEWIEFVITDEYRVIIYDSGRAEVEYGEKVTRYYTSAGDYAAALALVQGEPWDVGSDLPDTAEVTYVPNLQNAAGDAAGDGEMMVIYCPADPKEGEGTIQIGGAVCNEVSEYLLTRNWSKLNRDLDKASPGSIDFVISDTRRVVVYDSRVASIQYGEEVQWYRTGWGDYNAALALLHAPPHAVIDEADTAEEGSWLKATVVSDAKVTYLELGEYEGELEEDSMTRVQASQKGSILFYPDWETDQLVVSEHYYRRIGDHTQIEKKTFYLPEQDEIGAYVMDFSHRGGEQDKIIYYIQGKNGRHIFKLTFGEGAAVLSAVAVFKYGDRDIEAELSADDLRTAMKILSNKPLHKDSPSCGFTEDVSVRIDGEIYCIANDDCPIVYVSGRGMYMTLSKEENETLRSLLENYGFTFPCL